MEFYALANWQEKWGLDWKMMLLMAIITEYLSSAMTILRALHPLSHLILTAMLEVNWENLNLNHLCLHRSLSTLLA